MSRSSCYTDIPCISSISLALLPWLEKKSLPESDSDDDFEYDDHKVYNEVHNHEPVQCRQLPEDDMNEEETVQPEVQQRPQRIRQEPAWARSGDYDLS